MARTKPSACSAMRISKTACRKKQDDRLQSGDGRFPYSTYNYTICNHEIFRRYSGVPLEAMSGCRWAGRALPPSGGGGAGVHRRGTPCPRRGAKGGKGTVWFPCPLLPPPNPPSSRSAKHSRLNGGYGGSVPCVGQIAGRCYARNSLCVIGSAVSARPDGAGRSPCSAKSSASIKR